MKRRKIKILAMMLILVLLMSVFTGCGSQKNGDDSTADGKVKLRFWASGTEERIEAFSKLVENFNESQNDIYVDFQIRPTSGYDTSLQNVLSFSSAPDVFCFGDRYLKTWAVMDLLEPLDEYVASDKELNVEDIWPLLIQRFRYDTEKYVSTEESPLYAMPCGNIPTVIFYNKTVMEEMGIRVISKEYSDDLPEEEKHGFYHSGKQGEMPQKGETMVFNDKISMTWEEVKDLAMYLNKSYNPESKTDYGYYSHWWFNFGWTVGGDAIQYNEDTGLWEFTLGDKTRKVNADGKEMPSMYEALEFYLKLIQKKDVGGWGLMPSQAEVDTLGNSMYFTSQKVAMLTDTADMISIFSGKTSFEWDIAPIPKHELGIETGHSQSEGLGIWKNSKHKKEAYTFISYLASEESQKVLAASGIYVPNQREAAYEVYSGENQLVGNAVLLAKVSEYQRGGDWTYMPDDAWIDEWANVFNNSVRNSQKTLDEFLAEVTDGTNLALKRVMSMY